MHNLYDAWNHRMDGGFGPLAKLCRAAYNDSAAVTVRD